MSHIEVWFDEWEIYVGHSISQNIQQGIRDSDFVAVLLTRNSVGSGWVEKEWQSRIGLEAQTSNVSILPILGEDCDIPVLLQDKAYADIRTDYSQGMRQLLSAIHAHSPTGGRGLPGARIESGFITIERMVPDVRQIREIMTAITGGSLSRTEQGLEATLKTLAPFRSMQEFSQRLGLDIMVLTSDAPFVSNDERNPTEFKYQRKTTLRQGECVFDLVTNKEVTVPFDIHVTADVIARCHIKDAKARGTYYQGLQTSPLLMQWELFGRFELDVAL